MPPFITGKAQLLHWRIGHRRIRNLRRKCLSYCFELKSKNKLALFIFALSVLNYSLYLRRILPVLLPEGSLKEIVSLFYFSTTPLNNCVST